MKNANGKSAAAPLEVRLDPRVKTSLADLQKQFDLLMQVRAELAGMIRSRSRVSGQQPDRARRRRVDMHDRDTALARLGDDLAGAAFAGGGLKMGQAVGNTDKRAEYPADNPYGPGDVLATVYHVLGIDYRTSFLDDGNRPMPIVNYGKAIPQLV